MTGVLKKPRALASGDRMALVAPASPFDEAAFDAGVRELEALGFVPVWDDRVFARRGYVAGEADVRAAAWSEAWHDPTIAGLIAVRGGYGSVQMLPRLDLSRLAEAPKAFVGYSDLTTLLTALVCHAGIVAFHGPTVAGRLGAGEARYDRASFLGALTGSGPLGELGDELEPLHRGEARGRLLGGTLTQLAAAAGTPWALKPWDDTILLLEDVGERPYRLDRLIEQLRWSGAFEHVTGVVLGSFPRCDEPGGGITAKAVLADCLRPLGVPVVYGLPTGHVEGPALTVPLGVQARLVATAGECRFSVEEAAVIA